MSQSQSTTSSQSSFNPSLSSSSRSSADSAVGHVNTPLNNAASCGKDRWVVAAAVTPNNEHEVATSHSSQALRVVGHAELSLSTASDTDNPYNNENTTILSGNNSEPIAIAEVLFSFPLFKIANTSNNKHSVSDSVTACWRLSLRAPGVCSSVPTKQHYAAVVWYCPWSLAAAAVPLPPLLPLLSRARAHSLLCALGLAATNSSGVSKDTEKGFNVFPKSDAAVATAAALAQSEAARVLLLRTATPGVTVLPKSSHQRRETWSSTVAAICAVLLLQVAATLFVSETIKSCASTALNSCTVSSITIAVADTVMSTNSATLSLLKDDAQQVFVALPQFFALNLSLLLLAFVIALVSSAVVFVAMIGGRFAWHFVLLPICVEMQCMTHNLGLFGNVVRSFTRYSLVSRFACINNNSNERGRIMNNKLVKSTFSGTASAKLTSRLFLAVFLLITLLLTVQSLLPAVTASPAALLWHLITAASHGSPFALAATTVRLTHGRGGIAAALWGTPAALEAACPSPGLLAGAKSDSAAEHTVAADSAPTAVSSPIAVAIARATAASTTAGKSATSSVSGSVSGAGVVEAAVSALLPLFPPLLPSVLATEQQSHAPPPPLQWFVCRISPWLPALTSAQTHLELQSQPFSPLNASTNTSSSARSNSRSTSSRFAVLLVRIIVPLCALLHSLAATVLGFLLSFAAQLAAIAATLVNATAITCVSFTNSVITALLSAAAATPVTAGISLLSVTPALLTVTSQLLIAVIILVAMLAIPAAPSFALALAHDLILLPPLFVAAALANAYCVVLLALLQMLHVLARLFTGARTSTLRAQVTFSNAFDREQCLAGALLFSLVLFTLPPAAAVAAVAAVQCLPLALATMGLRAAAWACALAADQNRDESVSDADANAGQHDYDYTGLASRLSLEVVCTGDSAVHWELSTVTAASVQTRRVAGKPRRTVGYGTVVAAVAREICDAVTKLIMLK